MKRTIRITREAHDLLSDPGLRSSPIHGFKGGREVPGGFEIEVGRRVEQALAETKFPGESPSDTIIRLARFALGKKPD